MAGLDRQQKWQRLYVARVGGVMRVQSKHWLDYDPVALAVLVIGIGIVALLALSI
jgi:hypothetical protein